MLTYKLVASSSHPRSHAKMLNTQTASEASVGFILLLKTTPLPLLVASWASWVGVDCVDWCRGYARWCSLELDSRSSLEGFLQIRMAQTKGLHLVEQQTTRFDRLGFRIAAE